MGSSSHEERLASSLMIKLIMHAFEAVIKHYRVKDVLMAQIQVSVASD